MASVVRSSIVCERLAQLHAPRQSKPESKVRHDFSSGAELQFARHPGRPCCAAARLSPASAASIDTPSTEVASDPFAEKIVYDDVLFSRVLIGFITMKISDEVGIKPKKNGYDGFVEMSEVIMKGRSAEQQRETVLLVLNSVLPAIIPWAARNFFRPTELTCFLCAFFATAGFEWLVGDMEMQQKEVQLPDGTTRMQLSTVHIKKCRYLEQSGCVGMCVNMCKVPTQTFFTESFGMPLYMEPNFEDLSCKMIFGEQPPPLAEDPVTTQPCFSSCAIGMVNENKCKKLPRKGSATGGQQKLFTSDQRVDSSNEPT